MSKTKIFAHRGASGYAPENTLEAFALAITQGADGIELDVQLTKDGIPVVIHDETIDRVTEKKGWVKDYTLKELKELTVLKNKFPEYSAAKIPTLEEVLDAVKASGQVNFAILRAGYGRETSQVDTQFERNYAACKRLGIPIGVYWYSYATTAAEAEQEAKVCLQTIRGKQFEYPVAFDIEEARSLPQADALCTAFCSALEKQGYYAAIYTFKSALENNIRAAIKSRYDIFLSHVGVQQTSYAGAYGLWQYSWTGRIPGISGDVDLDYAYKDYPTIIQNAGLNGFTKETQLTSEPSAEDSTLQQILRHVASIDKKLQNSTSNQIDQS